MALRYLIQAACRHNYLSMFFNFCPSLAKSSDSSSKVPAAVTCHHLTSNLQAFSFLAAGYIFLTLCPKAFKNIPKVSTKCPKILTIFRTLWPSLVF